MNTKRKRTLHLHGLSKYWFYYENGKKELSESLFRRRQIQNKKIKMTKFIRTELQSELESELKFGTE